MYAWELQNRAVCHIYIVRTPDCPVAGFCAFWLVFDEIHINNIALRPQYPRSRLRDGADASRARRSETSRGEARDARSARGKCRRAALYERLGFYVAGTRRNYYTNPVEDALILWRDDPSG